MEIFAIEPNEKIYKCKYRCFNCDTKFGARGNYHEINFSKPLCPKCHTAVDVHCISLIKRRVRK